MTHASIIILFSVRMFILLMVRKGGCAGGFCCHFKIIFGVVAKVWLFFGKKDLYYYLCWYILCYHYY